MKERMTNRKLILGVMPTKRSFLSMEEANHQKNMLMERIKSIHSNRVMLVDIDDLCKNGIAWQTELVSVISSKFISAKIDALFIPFCDFGEEEVVARVAATVGVPVLIWGNRDERPNTTGARGRDTQCGMFAATKVLTRFGVKFSYIWNCSVESDDFLNGYDRFIRVAMVLKAMRTLRIAKIGERPGPFYSVMNNDANLIGKFGISVIPVSPYDCVEGAKQLIANNDPELLQYKNSLLSRFDKGQMKDEDVNLSAALKLSIENIMNNKECDVGAFECWSAFPKLIGCCPCVVLGEMADAGMPLSCETDVNGAVTMSILQAADLYETTPFLADLTIRNPQDDNSELLWHCGPFPYSLKAEDSTAKLVEGQENFRLKEGNLTIARFDEANNEYSIFCGEGETTDGPETIGTYVYLKVDNWKCWEEKLMFGPYIHHVGGVYGNYLPVLREVARYLDIKFDNAHEQGIHSL